MSRILGGAKGRFCPVAGGGGSLCVSLPVGGRGRGRGVGLCPVSCHRWAVWIGPGWITTGRRAKTGPVSITTGPARCRPLQGYFWLLLYGIFGPVWIPARLALSPALWRAFSRPVGLSYLRPVSGPLWGFSGPLAVGYGLPAGVRCLFGAKGVPVQSIPALSLDVGPASLRACPVWACFGPCGASSRFVLGVGVVCCFSSSTG